MHMAPGRFSNPGEFDSLSYWILDNRRLAKIMGQSFGSMKKADISLEESTPQNLRIAIQDSMSQPEGSKKPQLFCLRLDMLKYFLLAIAGQSLLLKR